MSLDKIPSAEDMSPDELIEQIDKYVAESREMMSEGLMGNMDGLEERVERLCEMVLVLASHNKAEYADKLESLMSDIGVLGKEMEAARDGVAGEIRSLSTKKKANIAYQNADASDNYGKDDAKDTTES